VEICEWLLVILILIQGFRVKISEAMDFSEILDIYFREVKQESDKVIDKNIQYLWRYYDR
jgi:hypothetical protein